MSSIALISKYALAPNSGTSSRLYELSKIFLEEFETVELITSLSCGHNLDLSEYKEFDKFYFKKCEKKINHIILKGPKINYGLNLKRVYTWVQFEIELYRYLKNKKYKMVFISSLSLFTTLNGFILKKRGSIFIFDIRDIWPLTIKEINPVLNIFSYLPLKIFEIIGLKYSDKIVSGLYNFDHYLRDYHPKYLEKYIYLPQIIKVNSSQFSNKHRAKKDLVNLCYCGTMGKVNGINDFLILLSTINIPNKIKFYFIGKGIEYKKLKTSFESNSIKFLPHMKEEDLSFFMTEKNAIGLHFIRDLNIYKYGLTPNKWRFYHENGIPIMVFSNNPTIINDNTGYAYKFNKAGVDLFINDFYSNQFSAENRYSRMMNLNEYLKKKMNIESQIRILLSKTLLKSNK